VDFGEEKEDKGYIFLEIEKGLVNWQFCPLPARPFRTINLDVSQQDDPQEYILKAIAKKEIQDVVVRLIYKVRSEQLDLINNNEIHDVLSVAHSYTIRPELVSQLARPRLPELGVGGSLDPLEALKTYLDNRLDLKELGPDMLEAAKNLLNGEQEGELIIDN
jgi:exonuclease SbcD